MSKKVVINNQHGGFGLSLKAQSLYAKKAGFELWFYELVPDRKLREYVKVDVNNDSLFTLSLKQDLGEKVDSEDIDCSGSWWYDRDLERDDPILVEVVEEMGAEEASGKCAKLKIVEIPDDVEWEVEEYDGSEWISEKHERWS